MSLPDALIHPLTGEVVGFNEHKLNPKGRITLVVSVMGLLMSVDFLLMNCIAPYNGILVGDRTVPMEVVSYARFQCLKFPKQGRVSKVRSN